MGRFASRVAIYLLVSFAIAYLWNMVLFRDIYLSLTSGSYRQVPIMQMGLFTMFLEGLAIAVIFSQFYRKGSPLREGLKLGLLVGVFSVGYSSFVVPAKFAIDPVWQYSLIELTFGIIHFGIVGAVLGFYEEHLRSENILTKDIAHDI